MWGWVGEILTALLEYFWPKLKRKPDTLQDANTPKDIAGRNADAYAQWLRGKQDRGDKPKR